MENILNILFVVAASIATWEFVRRILSIIENVRYESLFASEMIVEEAPNLSPPFFRKRTGHYEISATGNADAICLHGLVDVNSIFDEINLDGRELRALHVALGEMIEMLPPGTPPVYTDEEGDDALPTA